jgi:integrase
MPKPRFPNLRREHTRHGKPVWYYREGDGPRVRIKGEFGTDEFIAAYKSALSGPSSSPKAAPRNADTLGWLLHAYRKSAAWSSLSPATRKQRDALFASFGEVLGANYAEITRKEVSAGLQRRKATPFAANNWLKAMRSMFRWALDEELVETDPTVGVRSLKTKTDGFHAWTEREVEQFERKWPIGTRERVAFAVLINTGFRRGDAIKLGEIHRIGEIFRIRTQKTGQAVIIPVLGGLGAILSAGPVGSRTYIAQLNGYPWKVFSFGNWFHDACVAAGVPGSAHGLRKLAATRLWEAGVSEAQLDAAMGWKTGSGMSRIYARKADREKLSREAFDKLKGAARADENNKDNNGPF